MPHIIIPLQCKPDHITCTKSDHVNDDDDDDDDDGGDHDDDADVNGDDGDHRGEWDNDESSANLMILLELQLKPSAFQLHLICAFLIHRDTWFQVHFNFVLNHNLS